LNVKLFVWSSSGVKWVVITAVAAGSVSVANIVCRGNIASHIIAIGDYRW